MTTYYFEQTIEFSASGTVSFSIEASSQEAAKQALEEWIEGNQDKVCNKAEFYAEDYLEWESDGRLIQRDRFTCVDFELGDADEAVEEMKAIAEDIRRLAKLGKEQVNKQIIQFKKSGNIEEAKRWSAALELAKGSGLL